MKSNSTKTLNFWEREEADQEKRKKFFEESKLNATQPKLALFSYAPPFSYRDTTYNRVPPRQKNEFGKVDIGPAPFLVSPSKKGKGIDSYFSPPLFLQGDLYVDSSRGKHLNEHIRAQKAGKIHDAQFKPGGPVSYKPSTYEFMPTQPIHQKIIKKDENGFTITGPRNISAFAPKKGTSMSPDITIGKHPEYIPDDYEYGKKLRAQERALHHKKLQDQPFKPASLTGSVFSTNKQAFGGEIPEKKEYKLKTPKRAEHDRPFYPSNPPKTGVYDKTLNKFPEFMPDPIHKATRKEPSGDDRVWKRSYRALTSPASPIVMNNLNLRKEFPVLRKLKV